MILYHGSNVKIDKINFEKCKPFKDFGCGFYLTEIKSQALLMAQRTAAIYGGNPQVTEFEFDYNSSLTDLKVKTFEEPNEEWAMFVLKNRNRVAGHVYVHDYDIVIGPVADDVIATLFRNFTDGIINLTTLIENLKFKKVSSQYFFHTLNSLNYLKIL